MTVAGKGGRPRKWRSDADRVRAFRARQRGDEEPPTLDVALHDGDELAVAIEHIDQLRALVADSQRREATLVEELRIANGRADTERRRMERALADRDGAQSGADRLASELTVARERLQAVLAENAELRRRLAEPSPPRLDFGLPNRAERRRAAKWERRSH